MCGSLQLLEFLRAAMSVDQYAALLPSPMRMKEDFGLDPTTVLTIHRPLLARVQPPAVAAVAAVAGAEDGEIEGPQAMQIDAEAPAETGPRSLMLVLCSFDERRTTCNKKLAVLSDSPDAKVCNYLVYLKYWTLTLMPLMVYPKVPFRPKFSIQA